jgi:hypothetical protein
MTKYIFQEISLQMLQMANDDLVAEDLLKEGTMYKSLQ